ncbi:MAG: 50S ribosomal protein L23 [Candidatus Sumerlaeia bacterium]|nr:50S ribosomal protein L23 [Candidatus Sumerlaeia bacterium]
MERKKSPFDILIRPVITEKALNGQELNKYTFVVAKSSSKPEIKAAIQEAFGVTVESVNTMITKGRAVRRMRMRPGKRPDVKKAIVTLAKGEALELS